MSSPLDQPLAPTSVSHIRAYSLISILVTIGGTGAFLAPLQLTGVAKHYGLNAASAGGLLTVELLCAAIAAIGLAGPLTRMDVHRVSIWASLVTMAAQLSTCALPSIGVFAALRALAGLGCGALYAIGCYWASQQTHGVRILSATYITGNAVFGLALLVLPRWLETHGLSHLFLFEAALSTAAVFHTVLAGKLERHPPPVSAEVEARHAGLMSLVVLLVICAFGNGGMQMLWTFTEGVSSDRGYDLDSVALILGGSALFGMAGSLLAGILDRRFGMALPMVLALLGGAVAGGLIATSSTVSWFGAGVFVYGFSCFLAVPYFLSGGTVLDSSGRAATLAGATVFLAGALAPMLGGFVQDAVSLNAVAGTAATACLIAAVATLYIRRYLDAPIAQGF